MLWLIEQILANNTNSRAKSERDVLTVLNKGIPLGNLTSQFFANVYLNELDYFVKNKLKATYFIRYVDDFVIIHTSRQQLEAWKQHIDVFLQEQLKIRLHLDKSRVISLSQGIDFVGFRNHFFFKLLRKRNIRKIERSITYFEKGELTYGELMQSFTGWQGYAKQANTFKLRKCLLKRIAAEKYRSIEKIKKRCALHTLKVEFSVKFLDIKKKGKVTSLQVNT